MSLDARAIALSGVGFGALQVAVMGLAPVDETPPQSAPFSSNLGPIRKKTVDPDAKRRRKNNALLLTMLH